MGVNADVLTLDEAKELLGVSYMTAYRYVKSRRLEGYQVGGVWHIPRQALQDFQDEKKQPKKCTVASGDSRRTTNYEIELERCLVAGDPSGAWEVLKRAIDSGADVERVYLEILSPAMSAIGARWAVGELDISVEHQASAIATRLVGQLSPRCFKRGRRRGQILIGGPSGERHVLALAMLGDLLRLKGWEVLDLGGDTPAESFVHAASKMTDLVAVGVSVTSVESEASAASTLTKLRAAIGPDVAVVLGGGAIRDEEHARVLGADHFAAGARGFIDFLDQMKKKPA